VAIAVAPDGRFAAAWNGADGDGFSTFVRFFDSVGRPRTREIRVSTGPIADQARPALATTGDTYVVAWTARHGVGSSVQARRLTAGGQLIDAQPFEVDRRGSLIAVDHPGVACAIGGGCAISYVSPNEDPDLVDAMLRRLDPASAALGPQIRVSAQGARSRMAMLVQPGGALRLAWQQSGGEFNDEVMTASLAPGASRTGAAVRVDRGSFPRIAGDQDGNFTLVYDLVTDEDQTDRPIRARRYGADGTALGESFVVSTDSGNRAPDVAVAADGDFLVVWQGIDRSDTPDAGVYGRRYRADGTPFAAPFVLRSPAIGAQLMPAVAMDPDGDAIAAWSDEMYDGDGNGSGVFARRYRSLNPVDLSVVQWDATDPVASGQVWAKRMFISNLNARVETAQAQAYDRAIGSADALTVEAQVNAAFVGTGLQTSGFACEAISQTTVRCSRTRALQAGAAEFIELHYRAGAAGVVTSRITVSAAQSDPRPANDADNETTQVVETR
jgi:hypothetical protein